VLRGAACEPNFCAKENFLAVDSRAKRKVRLANGFRPIFSAKAVSSLQSLSLVNLTTIFELPK
jgi:hypothetical protein